MYKILGGDRKEYGPVEADELRRWIAEGRLNAQSMVFADGDTQWRALGTFPEFAEALGMQAGTLGYTPPPIPPASPQEFTDQILARPANLDIGACLSRSWRLVTSNFGTLFGASFVIWLINCVCERIPLVSIVYWLLSGILFGGLYMVFLKRMRGQPTSVAEVFDGFKVGALQLLLAGILTSLLTGIGICFCILPYIYLWVAWKFSLPLVADKGLEFWSAMELSRKVATRVWFPLFILLFVAFLPTIIASLALQVKMFSLLLDVFRDAFNGNQPDAAQLRDKAMQVAAVSLPFWIGGKIVFLFNLPFGIGAIVYAYEDLFGSRPAQTA